MREADFDMSQTNIDTEAFRAFERAAHSRLASTYDNLFTAVTAGAIAPLLDAAKVGAGTRLLDVASGPGHLAAAAVKRGAEAIGCDLAPAMIELARKCHPGIRFEEASAEALPRADGSFDAVTCAFGIRHFSEPEKVAAEFLRVLKPDGIAALSSWEGFERNRINGVFHETLAKLGVTAPPGVLPPGPPIDRFSDRDAFAAFLRDAGFADVSIRQVTFTHRLRDADELWTLAMGSFARSSSMIRAQTEETRQRIREMVGETVQQYAQADGLHMPIAFLVASGLRPH